MIDYKRYGVEKTKFGYWQVINKPSEKELEEYYAKKYYQNERANYRKKYPAEEVIYVKNKINQYIHLLNNFRDNKSGALLDIGCGEGFTLAEFKKNGWQVTGIDYSDHGCKVMNPNILSNLLVGNIYHHIDLLIEQNQKFDVLWLTNVLEHVLDPVLLLKKLKKLCYKNSSLVVKVPNDFSAIQYFLLEKNKINNPFWIAIPDHISYFNAESLVKTLKEIGWKKNKILADFPIDIFLINDESNYIQKKNIGKSAHESRIQFENLIHQNSVDLVNHFYEAMANIGLGRQIIGFFTLL